MNTIRTVTVKRAIYEGKKIKEDRRQEEDRKHDV